MSIADRLRRLESVVLVAVGGFAGATLRYAVGLVTPGRLGPTLLANVVGSLLLGVVLYEALYAGALSRRTRTVVATGFLASFTTYSTFAVESARSAPAVLVANVVATHALGIAGVLAGRAAARRIAGAADADPGGAGAGAGSEGDPESGSGTDREAAGGRPRGGDRR